MLRQQNFIRKNVIIVIIKLTEALLCQTLGFYELLQIYQLL